jgi:hypothetical protein
MDVRWWLRMRMPGRLTEVFDRLLDVCEEIPQLDAQQPAESLGRLIYVQV